MLTLRWRRRASGRSWSRDDVVDFGLVRLASSDVRAIWASRWASAGGGWIRTAWEKEVLSRLRKDVSQSKERR